MNLTPTLDKPHSSVNSILSIFFKIIIFYIFILCCSLLHIVFRFSSFWLWAWLCTASTSLMSWKGENLSISNGYCHQCTVFKNNQWIFFSAKNVLKTLMWLIMWMFMMKAILNLMKYGYMLLLKINWIVFFLLHCILKLLSLQVTHHKITQIIKD